MKVNVVLVFLLLTLNTFNKLIKRLLADIYLNKVKQWKTHE